MNTLGVSHLPHCRIESEVLFVHVCMCRARDAVFPAVQASEEACGYSIRRTSLLNGWYCVSDC